MKSGHRQGFDHRDVDYLFVYGTLRRAFNRKVKERIAGEWTYIGSAKVNAVLYDLGRYPGAVKDGKSEVVGEVYCISNPPRVFGILDDFEGAEFTRAREEVTLRGGISLTAWMYWYNQDPGEKKKIAYKDYLNYLKNKKTV